MNEYLADAENYLTDTENFIVAVAALCREALDDGSNRVEVERLLSLFDNYFDMKGILS